jgi:ribosomal protein S18 acetylase RimI-like enzyme
MPSIKIRRVKTDTEYICKMDKVLDNPVYNALCSGDAHLAFGTPTVKYFDEQVSPFAGFEETSDDAFAELSRLMPTGRVIFCATRGIISQPKNWFLLHEVEGLQFVYNGDLGSDYQVDALVPLNSSNAAEMVELANLTKPGPFNLRTIDFGNYYGIFREERLVAMAGQRFHPGSYTEISAVCTHPDFLGNGFAASLLKHQVFLIKKENRTPFLHVRADNSRAIALYERLGFTENGRMNFYVLRRS